MKEVLPEPGINGGEGKKKSGLADEKNQ